MEVPQDESSSQMVNQSSFCRAIQSKPEPDRFGNIISGQDVAGLNFKDAFVTMTNGGTELPDAFGIFVDDSGSVKYEEVEPSVQNVDELGKDRIWIQIS